MRYQVDIYIPILQYKFIFIPSKSPALEKIVLAISSTRALRTNPFKYQVRIKV